MVLQKKYKSLTCKLTASLHKALKRYAVEKELPMRWLINSAVEEFLEKKENDLKEHQHESV